MYVYSLRVDVKGENTPARLLKWLSSAAGAHRFLFVHETVKGSNPHLQGIMYTLKKTPALRRSLLLALPENKGNAGYSLKLLKPHDGDPYIRMYRYLCKGKELGSLPEVVGKAGLYDDEFIAARHNEYWDVNAAIKKDCNKRKRGWKPLEMLEERCKKKSVTSRMGVALECVSMYKENRKPMSKYYMKSLVTLVWSLVDEDPNVLRILATDLVD